ncbi:hypothetical protein Thermo_00348 [Thermoplasmatales archaeon]|nr:hypothetical protein Thermo_00348 [Thermoplasmatales archaeon]
MKLIEHTYSGIRNYSIEMLIYVPCNSSSLIMGLGKRDLGRKRKSIEMKIQEIEAKIHKNPLNKELQTELAEEKKKLNKL